MGFLLEGGVDKSRTVRARGPMSQSRFSFNLHQLLFWETGKNSISHPCRHICTSCFFGGKESVNFFCPGENPFFRRHSLS